MNEHQYKSLAGVEASCTLLTGKHLSDQTDRTLLYGYNCDRDTWHVYLEGGKIHSVIYTYDGEPTELTIRSNFDYVPDKRLYPARCDYEFCELLKKNDVPLPFTTFEEVKLKGTYYGEIL